MNDELYDIPGFEDYYAITKDGRVWSKFSTTFLGLNRLSYGYPKVTLSVNGKPIPCAVHRLMAITFLDLTEAQDLEVDHINSIRTDNRLENLRLLTRMDNQRARRGRLDTDTSTHKKCSTCNNVLHRDQFGKSTASSDGLRYNCKSCHNIKAKIFREKGTTK